MTYAEKNIIETYSSMFKGLSTLGREKLIAILSKSLKKETSTKEDNFKKAFGGFSAEKSPEEICKEIKSSRKFRNREIEW